MQYARCTQAKGVVVLMFSKFMLIQRILLILGFIVFKCGHAQLYSIGVQHHWQLSKEPTHFAGFLLHKTNKLTEIGASMLFGFSKQELNLKALAYGDLHIFEFSPAHFGGHLTPFLGLQYESRFKQSTIGQNQKLYHSIAFRPRIGIKGCYDHWNLTIAYQALDKMGIVNTQVSYTLHGGPKSRVERINEFNPIQRFRF